MPLYMIKKVDRPLTVSQLGFTDPWKAIDKAKDLARKGDEDYCVVMLDVIFDTYEHKTKRDTI